MNAKVDRSKVRLAEHEVRFKSKKMKCYMFIILLSIILGVCDRRVSLPQSGVLLPSSASERG